MDAAFASNIFSLSGTVLTAVTYILFLVFKPSVYVPATYWAIGLLGAMFTLAFALIITGGVIRLRRLRSSAKEDRRRIAAGLPLERDNVDRP